MSDNCRRGDKNIEELKRVFPLTWKTLIKKG